MGIIGELENGLKSHGHTHRRMEGAGANNKVDANERQGSLMQKTGIVVDSSTRMAFELRNRDEVIPKGSLEIGQVGTVSKVRVISSIPFLMISTNQ